VRTRVVLLGLLIYPLGCFAADTFDIKPGLWEMSSTVHMSGMPPMPNLDQLTPEQRARIEAAMKKANGQTTNTKSCVTKEGIDKAIAKATSRQNSSCQPKIVNMTSSKVDVRIECQQEKSDMKTTGDMSIERKDSEHFVGNGTMKSTGANGRAMDIKWSMTGAFVSSDCGNVKPADEK
jgi:hypothetical protein